MNNYSIQTGRVKLVNGYAPIMKIHHKTAFESLSLAYNLYFPITIYHFADYKQSMFKYFIKTDGAGNIEIHSMDRTINITDELVCKYENGVTTVYVKGLEYNEVICAEINNMVGKAYVEFLYYENFITITDYKKASLIPNTNTLLLNDNLTKDSDLDNLNAGMYFLNLWADADSTKNPQLSEDMGLLFVIQVKDDTNSYKEEIFFGSKAIKTRSKPNNSWSDWKTINYNAL